MTWLNDWLVEFLTGVADTLLTWFMAFMQGISAHEILSGTFGELLGGGAGATSVYTLAMQVHQVMVVPLAHSILALVMLVQLVKISQRIDATATLPAVKEIIFLAVFFVIFTWLINNSAGLCEAMYNEINVITRYLVNAGGGGLSNTVTLGDTTGVSPGSLIVVIIIALIMFLVGLIAWVVSFVVAYARAIQLYVMTAFSPIPFALMGFEETRSFGVNFCKNFVALCLAGVIMIFLLVSFPLIMSTVVSNSVTIPIAEAGGVWAGNAAWKADLLVIPIQMLAISILLIIGLAKSGAWARDILGG